MDFPLFLVILQDNLSVFLQTVVLFFFYLTFQSFGLIILFTGSWLSIFFLLFFACPMVATSFHESSCVLIHFNH